MFSMISTLKLISSSVSTLAAAKTLVDNCTIHLFYKNEDGEIFELQWKLGSWRFYNITKGSLAPKAKSSITSYLSSSGAEYLYFSSKDNHVIQLYRNSYSSSDPKIAAKWEVTDISQQANLRNVHPEGELLCWTIFNTMHVFFNASDGHIHELYCIHNLPYVPKSGWHHRDLTLHVFAPLSETIGSEASLEVTREVIRLEENEGGELMYPMLYPQIPKKQVIKGMSEIEQSIIKLREQEHILVDALSRMKTNTEIQSPSGKMEILTTGFPGSKEQLEQALQEIKKNKQILYLQMKDIRKKNSASEETFVSGNIGFAGTSQNIIYFSQEGKINLLRWGYWNPTNSASNSPSTSPDSKADNSSSWRAWLRSVSSKVGEILTYSTSVVPDWTLSHLSNFSNLIPPHLVFTGKPTSHCTSTGSQHFFFSDAEGHVHEVAWFPSTGKFVYTDITATTNGADCAPFTRLVSFSSNMWHFVYYLDTYGNIHEFRQRYLSSSTWQYVNISSRVNDIPKGVDICACTMLPLSKDMNSTVIYFIDKASHVIELACQWSIKTEKWTFVDIFFDRHLLAAPNVSGRVTMHVRGLIQSLSSTTQSSIYSAIETLKGFAMKKKPELSENDFTDAIEGTKYLKQELEYKLKSQNNRFLQQQEANESLQMKILELQQECQNIQNSNNTNNVNTSNQINNLLEEMHQLKQLLEENRAQLQSTVRQKEETENRLNDYKRQLDSESELRKQKEEEAENTRKFQEQLRKEKEEEAQRVMVLTGGLGWDVYKKVNLAKQEEYKDNDECVVCLNSQTEVQLLPCKHKVLCKDCLSRLKKQICPFCCTPFQTVVDL